MKYGSVCSGIEAATVAWHTLGWQPQFFSEIEDFPRAVLQHHYPEVPLHGDFTTIQKNDYGTIDLLVGGTPCQAFSVAGLRQGLNDDRGQLTLEFVKLAQRLQPKWILWENVPGVLSQDGGRAFGSFLGGLAELGYGFAYRILDAQYVRTCRFPRAVPQRRRRVFVVGYFGDWRPPAQVLFESQSLSWNPPPSRKTRENSATHAIGGVETSGTLSARDYKDPGTDGMTATSAKMVIDNPDVAKFLTTGCGTRLDSETDTFIAQSFCQSAYTRGFGQTGLDSVTETLKKENNDNSPHIVTKTQVRRLTPTECARLQGFPDEYLNITFRNKFATDGHKYRALGNSMACNVMHYIGEKIDKINKNL